MRDGDVTVTKDLSPSEQAVKYLLDRIQHDANLRHYMLGTQAFCLLVEAEAIRQGREVEEVEEECLVWGREGKPMSDVERYRRLLEKHDIDY